MSQEAAAIPAAPSPDRLIGRLGLLLVAIAAAAALIVHLANWRIAAREAGLAEAVAVAAHQAAHSRHVLRRLDRLADLDDGADRALAANAIVWELTHLVELDGRRTERAARVMGPDVLDSTPTRLLRAAEAMARSGSMRREEAAELRLAFLNEIIPRQDVDLRALEALALAHRLGGDRLRLGLGGLQLVLLGAAGAAVARRGRRRAREWMDALRRAESAARDRLLHDPLTQLPNAVHLDGYLSRLLREGPRRAGETVVLRIEFDGFARLRDAIGEKAASDLVRAAAWRIKAMLGEGDFAAHLGQDRFAVVACDLAHASDAGDVVQRLRAAFERPFPICGTPRRIECNIGVTLLRDDQPKPSRLLANAEIALMQARAAGSGAVRYFCAAMRTEVEAREALAAELILGFERGELVAYFQPQVDLRTGALVGLEALARWHHPKRGVLPPAKWLDIADKAGLLPRLGEVILRQVLEAITAWDEAGLDVPNVGVNFALVQLRDAALVERIKWEVDRRGIDPRRLAIEVLETVLVRGDTDLVVRNLHGLAATGFLVDLDDFGTGHASISNVRRFRASRIKIDRSFVRGLDRNDDQRRLVASIIAMGSALGIRTLAEGVERAEEEAVLRRIGCDHIQGFLVAAPMHRAATTDWVAGQRGRAATGT